MLTISRKKGESLILVLPSGDHITVRLSNIDKSGLCLGIDAPEDVLILSDELLHHGAIDLNEPIETH